MNSIRKIISLILFFSILLVSSGFTTIREEKKIVLKGTVIDARKQPVMGAGISINGVGVSAATSDAGTFIITVDPNAYLLITSVGMEPQKVFVKGRKELFVTMKDSNTQLDEIVVSSTLKRLVKITFDPAELELIKNQFFLKTRYRVPAGVFSPGSRLIIQPVIIDQTENKTFPLHPMVYDGRVYDILSQRGNICGDPAEREIYNPYAKIVASFSVENIINYSDSLPVENISNNYRAEVYVKVNTFCKSTYHDSVEIARGIINPIQFLDYNLVAMSLGEEYAPKQEIQSFEEKGEVKLSFLSGDANIYENVGHNASELKKLRDALDEVDMNATKKLRLFQIKGYTSPEGTYEYNLKLAGKRMKNAVKNIIQNLSDETLNSMTLEDESHVEPWSKVYERMQEDSLPESEELGALIKRARNNHNEISWGAKRLKCYSLIDRKYLADLRRVEYLYNYTEYRTLKNEEIQSLYASDPEKLTANEFWRFITMQPSLPAEKKEYYYRQALKVHPDLLAAANNLAVLKIEQNQSDTTILQPFLTEDAPLAVWVNQAVSYLQLREFDKADRIAYYLPNKEECLMTKALAAALNGKYEEAYPVIAERGGINKAVLLLCMKRNKEAYEALHEITDSSARAEYVRAIAANRLNFVSEALEHLHTAFLLDSSLEEIAVKDGDVLDLLEIK